jgi:hypothetical protein
MWDMTRFLSRFWMGCSYVVVECTCISNFEGSGCRDGSLERSKKIACMYKNRLTKDTMTINDQTRGVVVEALNPHVDRLSVGSRVLLLRAIDPSRRRQWGLMFPGRAHSDQGRIIWSRDSAFRWGLARRVSA